MGTPRDTQSQSRWASGGRSRTDTAAYRRWRKAVMDRDEWTCRHCGYQGHPGDGVMQADHIINVAQGGTETLDNGQALCKTCHSHKTAQERHTGRQEASPWRTPEAHPGLRQ